MSANIKSCWNSILHRCWVSAGPYCRTLSKFLFGAAAVSPDEGVDVTTKDEEVSDDEPSDESADDLDSADELAESETEADNSDEEADNSDEEAADDSADAGKGENEVVGSDSEDSVDSEDGRNVQELLPEDVFANNLNLRDRNKSYILNF